MDLRWESLLESSLVSWLVSWKVFWLASYFSKAVEHIYTLAASLEENPNDHESAVATFYCMLVWEYANRYLVHELDDL